MDSLLNGDIGLLTQIIQTQSYLTEAQFDLNAFMNLVAEQMQVLTPATGAVVELVEGDEMVYRAATGSVAAHIGLRLGIENSISGLCVRTNTILHSKDTENDPRVNAEACKKVNARSLVVAPLTYQNKTVGVLKILSKNPDAFSEVNVKTLQLMAGFIASGLAHQLYFETNQKLLVKQAKVLGKLQTAKNHMDHLAHYDFLTDLANRKTLYDKLDSLLLNSNNHSSLTCLMYLDIDHFKHINDNMGHNIGDALLKHFADRLKQCVRKNDLIARLGGDEFVILLNDIKSQHEAIQITENILTRMSDKFKFEAQSFNITISIGLTFYNGGLISPDGLIKQADDALYLAKNEGKNTFRIFSEKK